MNFHQTKPLSPAQKAWETRRAKAEGRAIVEARKVEAGTAAATIAGERRAPRRTVA